MFEQAQLILYGQFTEERLWGVVLLALSLAVAVPAGWVAAQQVAGWLQYVASAAVGLVAVIVAAKVWGVVLSQVRNRWFA